MRIIHVKLPVLFALLIVLLAACQGPGGPATRTGRAVDNAVSSVGHGVERTGEAIQDAAN